jgi:poly-gamma-glutamate synthesis protein (capsule biosynthesis protein)
MLKTQGFKQVHGLILALVVGLVVLGGCASPSPSPTPTATRTPKPTVTPTPTATLTPTPTPTPAFPVTAGCAVEVPPEACDRLAALVAQDPAHFTWRDAPDTDVTLAPGTGERSGAWFYAVAAPFFTVEDEISSADLQATWTGNPSGALAMHPLLATTDTVATLITLWGPPDEETVRLVAADRLLATAKAEDRWAILPFHALEPQWKALRVDGISLLEKDIDPASYPLQVSLALQSERRPEVLPLLDAEALSLTNRDEDRMTLVVMTGVTAMTRATAQLMDAKGVTYPAQDVQPWFDDADFVHVSNEVSFKPDCIAEGSGTMSFCSHDSYIALLEAINANIIELTGNHLEDKGTQWVDHSLAMYEERGWLWFGGGANQAEGSKPLTLTHNANQIAFLGCNTVGPFAGETSGGAARCDFPSMKQTIADLRDKGYLPIVTIQYLEDYSYSPTPPQMRDFRALAEAGAVMVQGSQAHQAQTMEFYDGAFVHYGLGNFFFDQMWSDGTRQEFVDRLTFYQGQLLSVDLRTAILEEFGRPRPMTVDDPAPEANRRQFLEMIFALSPQTE